MLLQREASTSLHYLRTLCAERDLTPYPLSIAAVPIKFS